MAPKPIQRPREREGEWNVVAEQENADSNFPRHGLGFNEGAPNCTDLCLHADGGCGSVGSGWGAKTRAGMRPSSSGRGNDVTEKRNQTNDARAAKRCMYVFCGVRAPEHETSTSLAHKLTRGGGSVAEWWVRAGETD